MLPFRSSLPRFKHLCLDLNTSRCNSLSLLVFFVFITENVFRELFQNTCRMDIALKWKKIRFCFCGMIGLITIMISKLVCLIFLLKSGRTFLFFLKNLNKDIQLLLVTMIKRNKWLFSEGFLSLRMK